MSVGPAESPLFDACRLAALEPVPYQQFARYFGCEADGKEPLHCEQVLAPGRSYLPPTDMHVFMIPLDRTIPVAERLSLGGELVQPRAQHALVLPCGVPLFMQGSSRDRNLHLVLPSHATLHAGDRARLLALDALAESMILVMHEFVHANSVHAKGLWKMVARTFADHLLACGKLDKSAAGISPLSERQQRLVGAYIQAHLPSGLSVGELARLVELSPDHFSRRFWVTHGISPMKLVARIRMERARELAESSSLSIAEVAMETGFRNSAHFSRAFKNFWNQTPTELRRQACRA